MKPWTIDARRFIPDDKAVDYIFKNSRIKNYLKTGKEDDNLILAGGKGSGKTLLLRYKSYLYRNNLSGFKFNTGDSQLVEYITIHTGTISQKELVGLCTEEKWKNIWFLTLSIAIIKIFGSNLPERLKKEFDFASNISAIVTYLLDSPARVDKLAKSSHLLLGALNQVTSGVAIFVDNIDQGIEIFIEDYLTNQTITHEQAIDMWVHAQTAIIHIIYKLTQINAHIKIFATVRREALSRLNAPVGVNYDEICTDLKYTRAETKEIFEKNIQMMDESDYVNKENPDYIGKFLGLNTIPHPFAKDDQNKPREENIFDFIYRHTYGRPRGIILMGDALYNDVILQGNYKNKTIADRCFLVRHRVNAVSSTLFEAYKKEIMPFTGEEIFENFFQRFSRSNLILNQGLDEPAQALIKKFFNLGLLGYVPRRPYEQNKPVQIFLPAATYNFQDNPLPETEYFLIHPSLDQALIDRSRFDGFYDPRNIIGDSYTFTTKFPNGVNGSDDRPKDIAYYLPRGIQGQRMDKSAPGYGQHFPLGTFYTQLFSSKENYDAVKYWEYLDKVDRAFEYLALYKILKKIPHKLEKSEEILTRINDIPVVFGYRTELKSLDIENLDKFAKRLYGRLLTIGSFLLLDYPIVFIHDWLVHGTLNSQRASRESDYRFLKDCFFIKGFPNAEDNQTIRTAKKEIFEYLSEHEKQRLEKSRDNIRGIMADLDWLKDSDYKMLERDLFNKGWLSLSF